MGTHNSRPTEISYIEDCTALLLIIQLSMLVGRITKSRRVKSEDDDVHVNDDICGRRTSQPHLASLPARRNHNRPRRELYTGKSNLGPSKNSIIVSKIYSAWAHTSAHDIGFRSQRWVLRYAHVFVSFLTDSRLRQ